MKTILRVVACVLFAIAVLIAAFSIHQGNPAIAWVAAGLLAYVLADFAP